MAEQKTYETQQVAAYHLAEADGFRQHPNVYWHHAETAPSSSKPAPSKRQVSKRKKSVQDKLTLIEGIGPKIAGVLNDNGIISFADLAGSKIGTLKSILKAAGPRYAMHAPNSWPKQASLARDGKMEALKKLQDSLDRGK